MTVWLITSHEGEQFYASNLADCAAFVFDRVAHIESVEVIDEVPRSGALGWAVEDALTKPTYDYIPPAGFKNRASCCGAIGRHRSAKDGRCHACRT